MIDHIKDSNKSSPDQIVKMVIEMILKNSSIELFSLIKKNPWVVDKLDNEQINEIILEPFKDKATQLELQEALQSFPALKQIVKAITKTIITV